MAFGCACGASGVHVNPRELEGDLVEHMRARMLERTGAVPGAVLAAQDLPRFLEAASALPEGEQAWLAAQLDRALRSWEKLAGRRGGGMLAAEAVRPPPGSGKRA